jgi:hypothetical protein
MLTDMEELPHGNWWIFPPPYRHTINYRLHLDMPIALFFLPACRAGDRYVCVATTATLATTGFRRVSGVFGASSTGQLDEG